MTKSLRFLHRSVPLAGVVAAALVPASALAQEGDVVSLDAVVVTGGRAPQRVSEIARTIYVVEEEEIQEQARAGLSLQEILGQKIPSFDAASRGTRTNYGQNLRGRSVLVLLDGVSLNSARAVSRQFDSIDPFNIARIEVLSGATSLYGGNATGGIINIITKKGSDAEPGVHGELLAGVETGFQGGDDRDLNGAAAVTYNNDTWDARIAIAALDTGAFYDGGGNLIIPDITQTSTQYNMSVDLFGTAGLQIDPTQRLELTAQYYNSEQDSEYGLYFGPNFSGLRDPSLLEVRSGYDADLDPATTRKMATLSYSNDDLFGQQLLLQGFWRSEELDFNPFPYGTYVSGSSQNTDFYGFKGALVAEPLEGLKITYGADGDVDKFESSQTIFDRLIAARSGGLTLREDTVVGRYPRIEVSTLAGFAEASYDVTDWLTVNGGYRHQYVRTEIDDFVAANQQVAIALGQGTSAEVVPGGATSYSADLFNMGATVDVGSGQQVYANFAQGFELPDPAKYYGQGRYNLVGGRYELLSSISVGDSALEAVKTDSFELGYRYGSALLDAQIAGYYSLSDKTIDYDRNTFLLRLEDQERRVYGVEGAIDARLPYGFLAGVNGHYVRTQVEEDGDWTDVTVTDASTSTVAGYVGWTDGLLDVRLQGQHVFDYEDDSDLELEGYTLFDFIGSYKYEPADMTVNFGILNVFDNDYTTIWGQRAKIFYGSLATEEVFDYKGRGRTYTVSLTKEF